MGFTKILARDAILGKKTAFGKLPDGRSLGCGIVVKERRGNVGPNPPSPPLITDPVIYELTGTHQAHDINDVHNDW